MKQLKQAVLSFLKVGLIGFGGGSALIPVIEKEMVETKDMLTPAEYTEHTIVANITPGALPVKLGAAAGGRIGGRWGMLLCAYAVSLPGALLTVLLLACISLLDEAFLHYIEYMSVGIAAFIIVLLCRYIGRVVGSAKKTGFGRQSVLIAALCTFLTFGKEIRQFLHFFIPAAPFVQAAPLLDISTIDLLVLAFFAIFGMSGQTRKSVRGISVPLLAAGYAITAGKGTFVPAFVKTPLQVALLVLIALFAVLDARGGKAKGKLNLRRPLGQSAGFLALIAGMSVLCLLVVGADTWAYLGNGAVSTATSFGGGEAYLTVADGIFVAGDFVSSETFYGQIVPIANALPGPILVKILSGIGFAHGGAAAGNPGGFLLAGLGFSIAVGVTSMVFAFVYEVYRAFADLPIFGELKKAILPVICGLLCTTILSMLIEIMKVSGTAGWVPAAGMLLFALCALLAELLHRKLHLHDVLIILLCGALSLAALLIF